MLAAVRNVAWGVAMAMAGILAAALAYSVWVILFWSEGGTRWFFSGQLLGCFDCDLRVDGQGLLESLLAVVVVVWLISLTIGRACRSIPARRS